MRYALCGSSSTGKTTLADAVCELRPDLRCVRVNARAMLMAMGQANTGRLDAATYRVFQRRYITEKFRIEHGLDNYLSERSFVDSCAYWLESCSIGANDRENAQVVRLCRLLASRYDFHFFLPYGAVPHEYDGWRHPDPEYHRRIDARIRHLLGEWELPHVTVEGNDLQTRTRQVLQELSNR